MDLPVLTRVAYDGTHQVRFRASVLAAATTQRPTPRPPRARWTEQTVYRVQVDNEEPPVGLYVVARVGRSLIAHRAKCPQVDTKRLQPFAELDGQPRRMPCLHCLPPLDPPSAGTVVERDKPQLLRARTTADLGDIVFPRRDRAALIGMTADTVAQLCHTDPDFDHWWNAAVAPILTWE